MRGHYERFRAAGADIVAILQGTPEQIGEFCSSRGIPFPCLSDPERRAYKAFALRRGSLFQILGPQVLLKGIGAAAQGFFMGKIVGDEFQMPGVFIVDRGIVRFAHYSKNAADNPEENILLTEIEKLTGRTGGV